MCIRYRYTLHVGHEKKCAITRIHTPYVDFASIYSARQYKRGARGTIKRFGA